MAVHSRITDYDRIADRFDTRYAHYSYDGVRETLVNFLGPQPATVLEVGCGTGHWLAIAHEARLKPSPYEDATDDRGPRSAKALAER